MGHALIEVPQAGAFVRKKKPAIPGAQHALIQRVNYYLPDQRVWSVTMAHEHNARGEGTYVRAAVSGHAYGWVEVDDPNA